MEEARHYHSQYGGKISILRKQELKIIEEEDPLDFGLDDPRTITTTVNEDIGNKYYILNICDQVDLTNGFRYIKELLLQYWLYRIKQGRN